MQDLREMLREKWAGPAPWEAWTLRGSWIEDLMHAAEDGCRVARAIAINWTWPLHRREWLRHGHDDECNWRDPDDREPVLQLVESDAN